MKFVVGYVLDHSRIDEMILLACGPDGPMNPHGRLALHFAGLEAMGRLRELGVAQLLKSGFSRREVECLQWAASGKTDWEIGKILELSEKTVDVYIERAKTKSMSSTRAQAIVVAARRGVISI